MFGRKKDTKETVYKTLIKAFNSQGFKFEKDDSSYSASISFPGDDMPVHMYIGVQDLHIMFVCYLPFKAVEENFKEIAWKLNLINKTLSFGSFSVDPDDGVIQFDYGYIFSDANPSETLILSIIVMIVQTVDKFDGELEKIAPRNRERDDSYMFG